MKLNIEMQLRIMLIHALVLCIGLLSNATCIRFKGNWFLFVRCFFFFSKSIFDTRACPLSSLINFLYLTVVLITNAFTEQKPNTLL